uniref:Ig-like domain-containing protein n=1 Tax=Denticeps clupeoides TaxID=299321 RepID=A0AAY4DSC0_9TELE
MSRTVVFAFCVLSATAIQQIPERHSLYYVYTAMSKPVAAPGIFEFVAMGLLDDRQIDYYNSRDKVKVPKQDWMKERNTKDYWNKGTQSRRSKEQWFKVNINILMERMKQNNSDLHVLQWRHGCEIEPQADGKPKFMKGVDEYSYDGRDFLSFDDSNLQWVAPTSAAVPTKQKWDGVPILNQYTKGYLESECVDWLSKFMKYGEKELERFAKDSAPRVYPLAKKTTSPDKLLLICFATGFYPKDIKLNIKKDNITLTEADGVRTGDVLPNGDDTHQLRKSVEIPESDKAEYECEVIHRSLEKPVIVQWDKSRDVTPRFELIAVFIVIGLILLAVPATIVLAVRRRKKMAALSAPPNVVGSTSFLKPGVLKLSCTASGFFPKNIKIVFMKDNQPVPSIASELQKLPNETYKLTNTLDIPQSDLRSYEYEVKHAELTAPITGEWAPAEAPDVLESTYLTPGKVELRCKATGFFPKNIEMSFKKNNVAVPTNLTGPTRLPDGTYELTKTIEIPEPELGEYNYMVNHAGLAQLTQLITGKFALPTAPFVEVSEEYVDPGHLQLKCTASGFFPKNINVVIMKKNEEVSTEARGPEQLPDGTYTLTKTLEIQHSDLQEYEYNVTHPVLTNPISGTWGSSQLQDSGHGSDVSLQGSADRTSLGSNSSTEAVPT